MSKIISYFCVVCIILTSLWVAPTFVLGGLGQSDNDKFYSVPRGSTRSATLIVGSGQAYSTIQSAVNAATAGDTIRVYAGTYSESVDLNKTLNMVGNGSANTIINNSYSGVGLDISAASCNVTGFRIIHCGGFWNESGLYIQSDNNRIENCAVIYNTYYGIHLDNSNYNTIKNSTFDFNNDYGILLNNSDSNTVINCSFSSNVNNGLHILYSNGNSFYNETLSISCLCGN